MDCHCLHCSIKRAWRSDFSTDPSDMSKCVREYVDSIGYTLGINLFLTVTGGEFDLCVSLIFAFCALKLSKDAFCLRTAPILSLGSVQSNGETNVQKEEPSKSFMGLTELTD